MSGTREPIAMKPGKPEKVGYEYKRNGTRNIFAAVEPLAGKHIIKVTKRRRESGFAIFIKELVTKVYKTAGKINIVCDNLNTHFDKPFYETFSKDGADNILRKINFYYTPKHAGWPNMAEIETNMLEVGCTGRRIASEKILKEEIKAWQGKVNKQKRKINWSFTKRDAYKKLNHYYVS